MQCSVEVDILVSTLKILHHHKVVNLDRFSPFVPQAGGRRPLSLSVEAMARVAPQKPVDLATFPDQLL